MKKIKMQNTKKSLCVAAWNIRTLLDSASNNRPQRRTALVAAELQRCNFDIAALSETRLSDEGSRTGVGGGYTFFSKVALQVPLAFTVLVLLSVLLCCHR